MKSISKALAKGTLATVAAGAMVMGTAAPAQAQSHRDRNDNGISTGEVIAGAVILGGLAAIIATSGNDDRYDRRDNRDYRNSSDRRDNRDRYDDRRGYNNDGNARQAVEQCVRAAESQAQRYSGGRAQVTEIRDVDRERGGFEIKGQIAVQDRYDNRGRNSRNSRNSGWDEGRFTCDYRRGRVVDVNYSGIRNL